MMMMDILGVTFEDIDGFTLVEYLHARNYVVATYFSRSMAGSEEDNGDADVIDFNQDNDFGMDLNEFNIKGLDNKNNKKRKG